VEKLENYSVVKSLEKLCLHLHNYLGKSPKRALQYETLATELDMEHLKILRNVKICWISVYAPIVRIQSSYRALVVTMASESTRKLIKPNFKKGATARKNLVWSTY
jgi:hypothetical protein